MRRDCKGQRADRVRASCRIDLGPLPPPPPPRSLMAADPVGMQPAQLKMAGAVSGRVARVSLEPAAEVQPGGPPGRGWRRAGWSPLRTAQSPLRNKSTYDGAVGGRRGSLAVVFSWIPTCSAAGRPGQGGPGGVVDAPPPRVDGGQRRPSVLPTRSKGRSLRRCLRVWAICFGNSEGLQRSLLQGVDPSALYHADSPEG